MMMPLKLEYLPHNLSNFVLPNLFEISGTQIFNILYIVNNLYKLLIIYNLYILKHYIALYVDSSKINF